MFEGFTRSEIKTSGARIVTVYGGKGPPLLLMHGNPFSHVSWHKVAPRLADEFTVVATDLRGYGDSEKPPGGKDHSGYSFRAMAQDQVEVMAALGFDRIRDDGFGERDRRNPREGPPVREDVARLRVLELRHRADIARTDQLILELFPEDKTLARWIKLAKERIHFQGLPARICWNASVVHS